MKVLYLHGLNSFPKEEKVEILANHFSEVYAPRIDWQNREKRVKLFSTYANLISARNITHVIGSSMGGQMAFYLALYCNIDALCFNPAFNFMYNDFGFKVNPNYKHEIFLKLGKYDNVISYKDTINFIKNFPTNITYDIIDIKHDIDLNTFKLSVDEFVNET